MAYRPLSSIHRFVLAAVVCLSAVLAAQAGPARDESLSDLTLKMLGELKRIRGLEAASTVAVGERSPAALRALLQKRIDEEYTSGQLKALQRLLALTGLVPPDYDLVERYVSLLASQALGFYDFKSETFFLSTAAEPSLGASVVLHELTHALQDQHFRIYKRLKVLKDDEDARTALQTLVEGEATAVMLELALEPSGRRFYTLPAGELAAKIVSQQEAFKDEPPVMRDFLYFPYEAGLPFMRAVRMRRPWSGVDELHRSPPASTEQVIHPERYLVRPDPPREVLWPEVGRVLPRRWRPLDENNLGELGAYLLVKPFLSDDLEAREAAAGWGGDRYLVLEERQGGRALVLMAFVWDTERDAREFAEAYRKAASVRSPDGSMKPGPGGEGWVASQKEGMTYLEQKGDRVLVLEGVEPQELDGFRRFGWTAKVSPPPPSGHPPTEGLARREMYRRRAESLWKAGRTKEAAEAARRALKLSDDDAEALYILGAVLASEDSTLAEGINYLTHALDRDPSLGPALLELGVVLDELGLEKEARSRLARALSIMPDHPGAAAAYAEVLLGEGEAEAAAEALKPWSTGRTKDPKLLTLLGRAALAQREIHDARRYLAAALELAPSSKAHLAMGELERRGGSRRAAEKHFRKASELDPSGAAPLLALGDLYREQSLTEEAAKQYEAAAVLDPLDPVPHTSMGRLALAGGDLKAAESWFTQALAADPRWRPALKGLRTVLSKDGRSTERLERLLSRPSTLEVSVRRAVRAGRRCLEHGLLKRARQKFEAAVRMDRDHPGAWAGLGLVHEKEERGEMAKVAYLKALDSPDPLPAADEERLFRWISERRIPEASDYVLKRFLHAKSDGERQRAALALGTLGDYRVVPLLLNHLESASPPVQAALAEAMGRLGDPSAVEPLKRLGAATQDPEVRSAVQRALRRLEALEPPHMGRLE